MNNKKKFIRKKSNENPSISKKTILKIIIKQLFLILLLPLLAIQPYILISIFLEEGITLLYTYHLYHQKKYPNTLFHKAKSLLLSSILIGYYLSILEPLTLLLNSLLICTITIESIAITKDIVNSIEKTKPNDKITFPKKEEKKEFKITEEAYSYEEKLPTIQNQKEKILILKNKK